MKRLFWRSYNQQFSLKTTVVLFIAFAFIFFNISSCKNDSEEPHAGSLTIRTQALVNSAPLEYHKTYTNEAGENYNIQRFRFYLSNIKLLNEAGEAVYPVPESYHLIRPGEDGIYEFQLNKVPAGSYAGIEYSIGVDSEANASIDNPGDLDPNNDMAWDWDTGYKFVSFSGRYFPEGATDRGLVLHIGKNENYRTISTMFKDLDLQNLHIRQNETATLTLETEISEIFKNPHVISFSNQTSWMFGPEVNQLVENYSHGMIRITGID